MRAVMRFGRNRILTLACTAALLLTGCGRTTATIHTAGVVVKVLRPALSGSTSTIGSSEGETVRHTVSWSSGGVEFVIRGKTFFLVNGHDYGTLKQGDQVVIDGPTGVVTVNGTERKPARTSGDD
jgi:hypothetical protein